MLILNPAGLQPRSARDRTGATKGNPEGLGEMMKRVLHEVQLAVPQASSLDPTLRSAANPAELESGRGWYDNRHGGAKLADTLPQTPSNLEGEQPLSQSLNSYVAS